MPWYCIGTKKVFKRYGMVKIAGTYYTNMYRKRMRYRKSTKNFASLSDLEKPQSLINQGFAAFVSAKFRITIGYC